MVYDLEPAPRPTRIAVTATLPPSRQSALVDAAGLRIPATAVVRLSSRRFELEIVVHPFNKTGTDTGDALAVDSICMVRRLPLCAPHATGLPYKYIITTKSSN